MPRPKIHLRVTFVARSTNSLVRAPVLKVGSSPSTAEPGHDYRVTTVRGAAEALDEILLRRDFDTVWSQLPRQRCQVGNEYRVRR